MEYSGINILTAVMDGYLLMEHDSIVAYHSELNSFIEGLGSFVCTTIDNLNQSEKKSHIP